MSSSSDRQFELWVCRQRIGEGQCNHDNKPESISCAKCRARRDKGDQAKNSNGSIIGEIISVDRNGKTKWRWY